jgi:hypothetical protein
MLSRFSGCKNFSLRQAHMFALFAFFCRKIHLKTEKSQAFLRLGTFYTKLQLRLALFLSRNVPAENNIYG